MRRLNIAIVGMGQRGVNVLERIAAMLAHHPVDVPLTIHIIDPAVSGQGIHEATQPDHLLVNTIAAQVTVYCDKSVIGGGPLLPGLSFLEWLTLKGYRMVNGKACIADVGEPITENAYLSRSLLGVYLTWTYDRILETLPDNVTIRNHRREAVDVAPQANGQIDVELDGGYKFVADFVFLTTGHAGCGPDDVDRQFAAWTAQGQAGNSLLSYVNNPYPITKLSGISPDATVAICGTGLTAADIVSALTVGVDGRFEVLSDQRLQYHPSGREPRIWMYSRQGLPAGGRAINQKGTYGQYKARFFTLSFIDECRQLALQQRGSEQLDFDRDLWPALKKEMAYVLRCTASGIWSEADQFDISPDEEEAVARLVAPLPPHKLNSPEAYREFIREFLVDDISNAFGGNVGNPEKAAADMLRDVRDNIRYAVDYAGLTPASHARFLSYWCSISNRLASGPPKERNIELLALIEAGVVNFFAPGAEVSYDAQRKQFKLSSSHYDDAAAEYADVLIRAKVDVFKPETSTSPLVRNMLAAGTIVPYKNGDFHPSGIAIDKNVNVINSAGASIPNLWGLGYIAEGAVFYTYVLPRPFANSRSLSDAGKVVISMFEQIKKLRAASAAVSDAANSNPNYEVA
ncbi:FAD/NAD(P)-binding protein [Janthinobacterium agaricidamnosum]|nr:FAD/NAD(P)-binding protein [Janthinobacterium agaricidamnosum]